MPHGQGQALSFRDKRLRKFGLMLGQLREKMDISQPDMAVRIGVNQSTISRVESGKIDLRDYPTLHLYLHGYGVKPSGASEWNRQLLGFDLDASDERMQDIMSTQKLLLSTEEISARKDFYDTLRQEQLYANWDTQRDELPRIIKSLLNRKDHGIEGSNLILLGRRSSHFLDVSGQYGLRMGLAVAMAETARIHRLSAIEGWVRGDLLPYTFLEQYSRPDLAIGHLRRAIEITKSMEDVNLGFLA